MKFIEKIRKKQADIHSERQPVIAFLGGQRHPRVL